MWTGQDRVILEQLVGQLAKIANELKLIRLSLYGPVGFDVNINLLSPQGGTKMAGAAKATVDLQILDDGKGVLFTLTPVNAAGATVALPAGVTVTPTSSAPGSLAVAQDPGDPNANPPRPPDTTGLVFLGTVPQPPVDATGIVVTFSATLPSGTVISAAAAPVDVVTDSSPVGFSITETAE